VVHRTRFNDQSPAFMGWRRDIGGTVSVIRGGQLTTN